MKRIVLLCALVVIGAFSYGMENEVSLPAQKDEMVTVKCIGDQDPEKGSEIQAPKKYIELSDVLKQQLEDFEGKNICIISLGSISLNTFKQLIDLLSSVHNLLSSAEQTLQEPLVALKEILTKKTDEELVLLANGADYLKIDALVKSIVRVIAQRIIEHDKEYLQQYEQNTCHFSTLNPLLEEYIIKEPLKKLLGHAKSVWSVGFTSGGKDIISIAMDDTKKLWNIEDLCNVRLLEDELIDGNGISVKKVGKYNYIFNSFLFNLKTNDWGCIISFESNADSYNIFTSNERILLLHAPFHKYTCKYTAILDNIIDFSKQIQSDKENDVWVGSISFMPNDKYVAAGFEEGSIKIWDVQSGSCMQRLTESCNPSAVNFSPDGKYIISGFDDGSIKIWIVSADSIYELLKNYNQVVPQTQNKHSNYFYIAIGGLVGGALALGYKWLQRR